jgi:hypothetical protein
VTSWSACERPAELVDVVVIVDGKAGDPVSQGQPPRAEMDASLLPFDE